MLAIIPSTRFRPSSISHTIRLAVAKQSIPKRSLALSFKPLHSVIELRLDLSIWTWRDVADLNCAPKFIECLLHDLSRLVWVADVMFVVDRQLLVGFIAVA